jgi:hypothetical protein
MGFGAAAGPVASALKGVPHSLQNLAAPIRAAPHVPHASARRLPQLMQKRAPAGFCSLQLGHVTGGAYSLRLALVDDPPATADRSHASNVGVWTRADHPSAGGRAKVTP